MANLTGSNVTLANITSKFTNGTVEDKTAASAPLNVSLVVTIIINSINCPFTVLLNVLVIMAVKRRPRLQNNTNIMLACLAGTDALTGLIVQPLFILWGTVRLLDVSVAIRNTIKLFQNASLSAVTVCSCLHLMLVTAERLVAIKFTMNYHYIVTNRNIKLTVIAFWILSFSCGTLRLIVTLRFLSYLVALVPISCAIFIVSVYVVLYRETRRHQQKIKSQQLPQEEVERFAKESKALKTTVLVVGAVILSFLPAVVLLLSLMLGVITKTDSFLDVYNSCARTFVMLNSLFNPLIYCWRKKEMRKFVFRTSTHVVHVANSEPMPWNGS